MMAQPRPLKIPAIKPIAKDLVLWLPFDDRSGGKAYDLSGKGNHGTLNLPTWCAGRRGSALDFDGLDDQVTIPAIGALHVDNIKDKWTVAGWFKLDVVTGNQGIIEKHHPFVIRAVNSNLQARIQSSVGWENLLGTTTLAIGTWYHGGATWSDAARVLSLYLNGKLENSVATSGISLTPSNNVVGIGGAGFIAADLLNGMIADARIYHRVLCSAEIKRLYEGGRLKPRG